MKEKLNNGIYVGERALYNSHDLIITNAVFEDGESPLKESSDIDLVSSTFRWKYPLWYCKNITLKNCCLEETARSGIWYTNGISFLDSRIDAPKTFRRAKNIKLINTSMDNALETLWGSENIVIKNMNARGDYFAMNSKNIDIENFILNGNYAFDGSENIVIRNATLYSKDSFWNCKNVTVYDSTIRGEYLAWNSSNITFINCTIESNQGLCYMDNVKLVNCVVENTDLAFELCSNINATIVSHIDSIKNPISGIIKVKSVGEIILDEKMIDPLNTKILVGEHNEI